MIRRYAALAVALVASVWLLYEAFADVGSGLYNRQHVAHFVFYRTDSTMIDTTESGSGTSKMLAYPTFYTDTTGHSVAGTYSKSDGHGYWYWTNPSWEIYDIYSDSAGTYTKRADDLLIAGRVLGDSVITDSTNFKAAIIPGSALVANTIKAGQIAANAIAASELADAAADSAAIAGSAIHPTHFDQAQQYLFRSAKVDSILPKSGAVSVFTVAKLDSVILPSDAVSGTGLKVTGGKIGLDLAPGSGFADLEEGADYMAVKLDSTTLGHSASGINLNTGSTPAVATAILGFDNTAGVVNVVWRQPTFYFPFDPDSSIYGTAEIGEAAGDTLVTAWKSGAVTGDLVICGWADHPLNGAAGSAIINARVVGSKQVQITRYPAVSMTSGGHTIWYLVVGRP